MFEKKQFPTIVGLPAMLTGKECDDLINMGLGLTLQKSSMEGATHATREGSIGWINPVHHHELTEKIFRHIAHANKYTWKFSLYGFLEALQFSIYAPGDHYGWHKDLGSGELSIRKLSFSIQLSKETDYKGGDLEFVVNQSKASRARGTLNIFPSYEVHRVTPVTEGVRYALVGWVSGKPLE